MMMAETTLDGDNELHLFAERIETWVDIFDAAGTLHSSIQANLDCCFVFGISTAEELPGAILANVESFRRAIAHGMPYDEYLKTDHWSKVRGAALKRAGHRCQTCNAVEQLNVHHRTYERLGSEIESDLTVLCRSCHHLFHKHRKLAT